VVLRELPEQARKDGPILLTERCQQVATMGLGHPADLLQALLAGRGEVQSVVATVRRVAPAHHETVSFELVDQGDERAGQDPELGSQSLLRAARRRCNRPEQPGVGWGQTEGSQALGEPYRREAADLSEQECHLSRAQLGGAPPVPHIVRLACMNHSCYE
jgi:hypothetical protein